MGWERHAKSGVDRSGDRLFELPSQERFVPRCRQLGGARRLSRPPCLISKRSTLARQGDEMMVRWPSKRKTCNLIYAIQCTGQINRIQPTRAAFGNRGRFFIKIPRQGSEMGVFSERLEI